VCDVQGAVYIGGDFNMTQCAAAFKNVMFAEEMQAVHIINADVTGEFVQCLVIRHRSTYKVVSF